MEHTPSIPSNRLSDSHADLLRLVKAGFLLRGTSLSAWCGARGVYRQNVYAAITGRRAGPRAIALRKLVCRAAGVDINAHAA